MREFLEKYNLVRPNIPGFVFDLQLFAAEDEGRTEDATEKKIREAREKGQVAKTQELPQSLVVIFGVLVVFMFASWIYDAAASMTKYYLSSFSRLSLTPRSLFLDFIAMGTEAAKVVLPVFLAVIIAAVAGNVAQVGFQVSTHPLKMDWKKVRFDPATIMKKVFFSKQVAMNLLKSIAKVLAIGFTAYLIIVADFEKLMTTPDISMAMALKIVGLGALKIILCTSIILLLISIPDYFFQKREFLESLKMTKQELKEEIKESVGDPNIRARMREMYRRNMLAAVPKADVIVTNPTHYAVALLFDTNTMIAPTVTAKGEDGLALLIREIAKKNDVPMIE
ncbi:MAG: EscU/YscU/HrcU family type III secretion system export apparatus switch protein, partial [Leptospirales bacterium]|nr:EscU/YscU/HrcU family type III secretion system export apparatus switch protein [Leptospirales bacterium]